MTLTRKVGNGDIDDDVTIKIGALTHAQLAALDVIPEGESALTFELREALHRLTPALPSFLARTQPAAAQIDLLTTHSESGLPSSATEDRRSEWNSLSQGPAIGITLDAILRWVVKARCWALRLGRQIAQFATWSLPTARRQGLIAWTQTLRERWEVFRALSFAREAIRWTRLARSPQVSRLGRTSRLGDRS